MPPKFNAEPTESASQHWLAFEDYVAEHELDEATTIKRFRLTLGKDARWWYEANKAQFQTVVALRSAFKERYSKQTPRSEHVRAFRAISLRPGEKLAAFRNRLDIAAGKANVKDEEDILIQFIEAMPAHMRPHLRAQGHKTLQAAMGMAQAYLTDDSHTQTTPQVMTMAENFVTREDFQLVQEQLRAMSIDNRLRNEDRSADQTRSKSPYRGRAPPSPSRDPRRWRDQRQRSNSRDSRGYWAEERRRSASRDRANGNYPRASRERSQERYFRPAERFSRSTERWNRSEREFNRDQPYRRWDSRDRRSQSREPRDQRPQRGPSPAPQTRRVSFQNDGCHYCKDKSHNWRQCRKFEEEVANQHF